MLRVGRRVGAAALLAISGLSLISTQAQAQLGLGSLIVAMTSPASGSIVSDTVPVRASVSVIGLITVRGVQFQLDGANLGAEDTSAPYSVSWNTTTTGNGSHTLTAVARDLLGVQYTSDPVTVTVANSAPPPPADTTPPTVSITSPSSGQTVLGTVSVTASASDDVGVAGVQFLLDGTNLGAESTTAPYSTSWNTTAAANGSHTLTAVARDAAGNRSDPSAPVTVTVANGAPPPPPPPPPGSTTRFEETDPSVTYAPAWTQDGTRSWSGGTAAVSATPGAQVTFTFTGPSVSWIGGRATFTGIARISLDGVFLSEVDTYSKTEEIRVPMFAATGLANTS